MLKSLCLESAFKFLPSNCAFPILKGPLKGSRWISGATPGEAKGLSVLLNLSEKSQVKEAMKHLNQTSVCYDIGANVGFYTLLFSRYAKHVYAFEPVPRNISYLNWAMQINKIVNADIIPFAVAAETKTMHFQESEINSMGKLSEDGGLTIQAIRCDDFALTHEIPSLIKIDVEGAELEVLHGAKKTLIEHHPIILLSLHSPKLKIDCSVYLESLSYKLKPISHSGNTILAY